MEIIPTQNLKNIIFGIDHPLKIQKFFKFNFLSNKKDLLNEWLMFHYHTYMLFSKIDFDMLISSLSFNLNNPKIGILNTSRFHYVSSNINQTILDTFVFFPGIIEINSYDFTNTKNFESKTIQVSNYLFENGYFYKYYENLVEFASKYHYLNGNVSEKIHLEDPVQKIFKFQVFKRYVFIIAKLSNEEYKIYVFYNYISSYQLAYSSITKNIEYVVVENLNEKLAIFHENMFIILNNGNCEKEHQNFEMVHDIYLTHEYIYTKHYYHSEVVLKRYSKDLIHIDSFKFQYPNNLAIIENNLIIWNSEKQSLSVKSLVSNFEKTIQLSLILPLGIKSKMDWIKIKFVDSVNPIILLKRDMMSYHVIKF